jgi:hypothetical protein
MNSQELEEKLMVEKLGEEYFNINKDEFINLPKDMSSDEYRKWRKEEGKK